MIPAEVPSNSRGFETRLLTPHQTRERLGVSIGTLAVWRCTRRYNLPFVRVGSKVMYREEDVERFISSRRVMIAGSEDATDKKLTPGQRSSRLKK
jgi:Helix-turn-helix domain